MDEDGEPDDMFLPDEIQGYMCVSADPRRSWTDEGQRRVALSGGGGENLILTTEELRRSLQAHHRTEDQTV